MSEKKAHDVFNQYMQAELKGNDLLAKDLENELKKGGWIITAGPEGMIIVRMDNQNSGVVDAINDFIPSESKSKTPLSGDQPANYNWLWWALGSAAAIGLIIWVAVIIKKRRNAFPG